MDGPLFFRGRGRQAANTTAETLRHYDRIGLVKPSKKDEWTHYRYYTEQDIVRLNTVRALQLMDLPLQEIKKVLEYDDLEKIIAFSSRRRRADEKIAALQFSKAKIQLAKADYVRNLELQRQSRSAFLKEYPQRVILLSDTLEMPTWKTFGITWGISMRSSPRDGRKSLPLRTWPAFTPRGKGPGCLRCAPAMWNWRGSRRCQRGVTCAPTAPRRPEQKPWKSCCAWPGGVWGRAILYRAAHCRVGNFTVEL